MTCRTDLDPLVELDPTRSKSSLRETALGLDDEADDGTECQTRLEDRRRGGIRMRPTRRRADKNVCELVGFYIGMIGEGSVLAPDADTRPGGLPDLGTLAAAYLRCEVGPVFYEHGGWDGPNRDT